MMRIFIIQKQYKTPLFTTKVPACLLFLILSALVANPKKTTLHGGQFRSWSAEQGKEEKEKSGSPPPPQRAARSEKKIK